MNTQARAYVPHGAAIVAGAILLQKAEAGGRAVTPVVRGYRPGGAAPHGSGSFSPAVSHGTAGDGEARPLCETVDPEAFFPERGGSTAAAKRVCLACPRREACLEDALETGEQFGVRGGLDERERALLSRRRPASQPPLRGSRYEEILRKAASNG